MSTGSRRLSPGGVGSLLIPLLLVVATAQAPPSPPGAGAIGAWLSLSKLRTTASLMQITAHPDDEQGALLAAASLGEGAHTTLLSLNRGEAGDNAIGPELFDGLGLIRTEELLLAGRYYGLDDVFFTSVADYGFSKRLDEALERWDRTVILRDMVRTIRSVRPLVVVSRWQGNERDGHGQHQAAGALAPEAVAAAGDPSAFRELEQEGLRTWRVPRSFTGGVRAGEPWHAKVETGQYDAVLGASPYQLGRMGLAMQRSQTGGRYDPHAEPAPLFYTLGAATRDVPQGAGLFEGLDTTLAGIYALLEREAPAGHSERLAAIGGHVDDAVKAFAFTDPSLAVPSLARGLEALHTVRQETTDPDVRHVLDLKVRQFERSLAACAQVEATAVAEPPDAPDAAARSPFAAPPLLDALTPGGAALVRVRVANRGRGTIEIAGIEVLDTYARRALDALDWRGDLQTGALDAATAKTGAFRLAVRADHPTSVTYYSRSSIAESAYSLRDPRFAGRARAPAPYLVRTRLRASGVEFAVEAPVQRRESLLPHGYALRELEVLPPVDVAVSPSLRIVRAAGGGGPIGIQVTVSSRTARPVIGSVQLRVPPGWAVTPITQPLGLQAGAPDARLTFGVVPRAPGSQAHDLQAVVRVDGRDYTSSLQPIRHRDLGLQYVERQATTRVRAVDVRLPPNLRVGYVMGVGDEVPEAIRQLGATVDLLDAPALARGDLARYHAIVTGTRAYAVRADLRAHNGRLLEYVRQGGHLVVLYNTPEFVPREHAPLPATLPQNAEEVCEEDAAVEILAPSHPLMTTPNAIGTADFAGWIEQRGSKFFATWDAGYTPILSSHDRGQAPQQGGLLTAPVGEGHYTYMAYALHRQLPYGVPGAYRLLANLLSLGYEPPAPRPPTRRTRRR